MAEPFTFDLMQVVFIALIAVCSTSLSQFISWVLLYRKEGYKYTKSEIQKLNKKLEKLKNSHVIQSQSKSHEKKIGTVEAQLKAISQSLTFDSMKSNVIVGILMIGVVYQVGSHFSGKVIARLPFEPFSLMRGITHRNLTGEDYCDCAYLLFYILFAFIWRTNLKRFLGFEAPKPAVSFFDPPKYKPQ